MFNQHLVNTNKKTVEYFECLFKKYFNKEKNFPNSIILWGTDYFAQYAFALEIARILNCKKNHSHDCNCINCQWIRQNEHPEIKTVSKITSKQTTDKTKNISVKQVQNFLEQINTKSNDYRVIIFCDADYETLSQKELSNIENYKELSYIFKPSKTEKDEKIFVPKPLTENVFKDKVANALLKTLEEPPKNLLFIFLTASYNDLISTIISRSQMFYIQNSFIQSYDYTFIKNIFKDFPNLNKNDFEIFTTNSQKYLKEYDITVYDYLETIQAYFTDLLSVNHSNQNIKEKILSIINHLIISKKYDNAGIKSEYIFDNLWINIS